MYTLSRHLFRRRKVHFAAALRNEALIEPGEEFHVSAERSYRLAEIGGVCASAHLKATRYTRGNVNVL